MHTRIEYLVLMLLFGELLICPAAAHGEPIDMPLPLRCPHAWVPANVVVTNNSLLELSNEMASRSPAFRRRLQQIGQTPTFRARIRFVARITATPLAVAQTAFSHAANGGLFADIQIPTRLVFDRQDVRMIAHEIEHVMEQIEGIDLHALARTPHSGVYRVYDTRKPLYETDRATLFGQIVENRLSERRRRRLLCRGLIKGPGDGPNATAGRCGRRRAALPATVSTAPP